MKKSVLNRLVSELIRRSGSGVSVKLESHFPGGRLIGGKYGMETHAVTMYTEVIKQQCLQVFGSLDAVYDYFAVVLAHELGHAADQHLAALCDRLDAAMDERTRTEILLQIEENAWNHAMPWLLDVDPAFTDMIVEQSLAPYREELAPVIA
ncbi:hypothetical protein HII30_01665 [Paenibacillus lemnae]|uniref:Peptidase M48 domain-containing protein n=1 Tax=Paenibacillus lemnae TaxID=1330551 RepID=A0A848M4A1_PAELE|nr:hypothetical protein [Paenibacillus lemnae]NMO94494.1 hypothetical protein [Paenibacillus lemnae]